MINLLLRAKPFIKIWLAGSVGPQCVPVVPISTDQPVELEQKLYKFWIALEHLIVKSGSIPRVIWWVVLFCKLSVGWNLCLVYSFHKWIIIDRVSFFVFWHLKTLCEVKPCEVRVCYEILSLSTLFKNVDKEVKELILRFKMVLFLWEHPNVSAVQILGGAGNSCVRYNHTLPILSLDSLMKLDSGKHVWVKHGSILSKQGTFTELA